MKVLNRLGILCGGLAVLAGYPYDTDVTHYEFVTPKVKKPVTFVILSDLHGQTYGKGMQELIQLVKDQNPDAILIPGDLFDEFSKDTNAFQLLDGLQEYPIFYSTGNHEEHRDDVYEIKQRLQEHHVNVLNGTSQVITLQGTTFEIGGIPSRKRETSYTVVEVNRTFHTDHYRILLSHRPHWVHLYKEIQSDWIISGHAHGGQWCIPFITIGLGAPQQGFLPAYVRGIHKLGKNRLLISRGLVRHYHYLPRLFNNPEVVVLTMKPKVDKVPIPG